MARTISLVICTSDSFWHRYLANCLADFFPSAALLGMNAKKFPAVSWPYGHTSRDLADAAGRSGLEFGFTIEPAFNSTTTQPLLFARADANDVPGGKAPKFAIDASSGEIVLSGLGEARKDFLSEAA